jgi:hypothetical protein
VKPYKNGFSNSPGVGLRCANQIHPLTISKQFGCLDGANRSPAKIAVISFPDSTSFDPDHLLAENPINPKTHDKVRK